MTYAEYAERMASDPNAVFVFGSNTAGRHNKGAALTAKLQYGAIQGQAVGRQGRSYAIMTRHWVGPRQLRTLSLTAIELGVKTFLEYAARTPKLVFLVTRIGCGFAGYEDRDIAPFFAARPPNVFLPDEWVSGEWCSTPPA